MLCVLTNGMTVRANSGVPGVSYGRERHLADEDFVFGDDAGGRHAANDGVRGGVRGMAMHHGFGFGDLFIDFQVHEDLAGARAAAGELFAFEIDHAEILRAQVGLAQQGGGTEDLVGADAIGDVAAVAVHVLALPELAAHVTDLFLYRFGFGRGEQVITAGRRPAAAADRDTALLGEFER